MFAKLGPTNQRRLRRVIHAESAMQKELSTLGIRKATLKSLWPRGAVCAESPSKSGVIHAESLIHTYTESIKLSDRTGIWAIQRALVGQGKEEAADGRKAFGKASLTGAEYDPGEPASRPPSRNIYDSACLRPAMLRMSQIGKPHGREKIGDSA